MKNPFQFGSVVGGDTFCNRKKEMADIQRAMQNGDRLFVYSERRLGKTSLVRIATEGLPKKQFIAAYVDLLGTDDEGSFAAAVARALAQSMASRAEKMLEIARNFFSRLAPSLTLDEEGKPQLSFSISKHSE